MSAASTDVDRIGPEEAWRSLRDEAKTQLVDVRTRAEWSFVGAPDLSGAGKQTAFLEWRHFPAMDVNQSFVDSIGTYAAETGAERLLFICRSGARSLEAARSVMAATGLPCANVEEGFEGDLDPDGKRGAVNGWKAAGLPWRQS